MKKQVYEIDGNGLLKEIYVAEVDENGKILDEDKVDFISIDPPHGLFKPKWNGTEWIEGESDQEKAEREALERLNDLQPSPEELDEAKTEIKILTLLSELEMI